MKGSRAFMGLLWSWGVVSITRLSTWFFVNHEVSKFSKMKIRIFRKSYFIKISYNFSCVYSGDKRLQHNVNEPHTMSVLPTIDITPALTQEGGGDITSIENRIGQILRYAHKEILCGNCVNFSKENHMLPQRCFQFATSNQFRLVQVRIICFAPMFCWDGQLGTPIGNWYVFIFSAQYMMFITW